MGNRVSRVVGCFVPVAHDRDRVAVFFADPALDEGLGHSFCYVRPALESLHLSPSHSDRYASELHSSSFRSNKNSNETVAFRAISGASVSANTSTPHTILSHEQLHSFTNVPDDRHAAFESTASFASLPLQPVPRGVTFSGPISATFSGPLSAPLERVFMSGPLERSYMSGPIDAANADHTHFSAPLAGSYLYRRGRQRKNLSRFLNLVGKPVKGAFTKTISTTLARTHKSLVVPVRQFVWRRIRNGAKEAPALYDSNSEHRYASSDADPIDNHNLQWAQGKAGEDRVHVVVSEDHGWLFVGIYDGFNGPDAPDFLMRNLYRAVYRELQGLLWDTKDCSEEAKSSESHNAGGCSTTQSADNSGLSEHREGAHAGSEDFKACSLPRGLTRSRTLKELLEIKDSDMDDGTSGVGTKQRSRGFSMPEFKRDFLLSLEKSQLGTKSSKQREDDDLNIRGSQSESGVDERANESVSCTEEALGNEEGTFKSNPTGAPTNCRGMERAPMTWTERSFSMSSLRHKQMRNKESHRKMLPQRDNTLSESKGPDKEAGMKCEGNLSREGSDDHDAVLKALSRALDDTEQAYLNMADHALEDNPELALMGSCILVALIKDKDVYILNVGDSRAIVAQQVQNEGPLSCTGNTDIMKMVGARDAAVRQDLECISEESPTATNLSKLQTTVGPPASSTSLIALQLSQDHSTSIEEEVDRIKLEHPDDNMCILNDRVKGRLKVTRAFGAGFLKKPRWNSAILQMFQIDYVGSAPYVSCSPALRHHRLGPHDRFLILSSDGLYQYFSNQEVVSHVEWFMEKFPEGDPAQYLIEELLFRAAKKAGMDFHELLDIPQGDRRKYHDDVSVMIISLEGKVWRSSG